VSGESVVSYDCDEGIARVTINQPPVNALSLAVRQGLVAAFERAALDGTALAVVLAGAGRCFSAGGDIREFGTPAVLSAPRLTLDVQPVIERMQKPVIAEIHGMALGGGLETAMVCHYRVAAADAIIALPEVKLGIMPLGGTQRLPRLLPLEMAIDLILSGRKARAAEFSGTALFDQVVETDESRASLDEAARSLALAAASRGPPYPRVSQRPVNGAGSHEVIEAALSRLDLDGSGQAPRQALAAIHAAMNAVDFDDGLRKATTICDALLASEEARAAATRFLDKR
jgi:enoyl-CoA hydratase/carnithine racemase